MNPNVSSGYVSCTTSGSSTYTSDSGKSKSTVRKLPATWSAVSGNITQQDSRSVPRCFDDDKIGSAMKNKKVSTKPHQVPHTRPSLSLIQFFHMYPELHRERSNKAPNQKMDKKIQKPQNSTGSHGSSGQFITGMP